MIHVRQFVNDGGELLAYLEFMNTFQFPVPPKEYAVAFGAMPPPGGAWCYNLQEQLTVTFLLEKLT